MHRGERGEDETALATYPPPIPTLSPSHDQVRAYDDNNNNSITPAFGEYHQPQAFNTSIFLPADRLAQSLAQLNVQLDKAETNSSYQEGEAEQENEDEEEHTEEASGNEVAELEGDLPPPYHAFSTPVLRQNEQQQQQNIMIQSSPRYIPPDKPIPMSFSTAFTAPLGPVENRSSRRTYNQQPASTQHIHDGNRAFPYS
jgi:hypothetical protein